MCWQFHRFVKNIFISVRISCTSKCKNIDVYRTSISSMVESLSSNFMQNHADADPREFKSMRTPDPHESQGGGGDWYFVKPEVSFLILTEWSRYYYTWKVSKASLTKMSSGCLNFYVLNFKISNFFGSNFGSDITDLHSQQVSGIRFHVPRGYFFFIPLIFFLLLHYAAWLR